MSRFFALLCLVSLSAVITAQDDRQEIIKGSSLNPWNVADRRRAPEAGLFHGHGHGHNGGHHRGGGHHGGGHPMPGGFHGDRNRYHTSINDLLTGTLETAVSHHQEMMQRLSAARRNHRDSQTGVSGLGHMQDMSGVQYRNPMDDTADVMTARGAGRKRGMHMGGHHDGGHMGNGHHPHSGVHAMHAGGDRQRRGHHGGHHRRGYSLGGQFQPAA